MDRLFAEVVGRSRAAEGAAASVPLVGAAAGCVDGVLEEPDDQEERVVARSVSQS
jgi:hypothetical protein